MDRFGSEGSPTAGGEWGLAASTPLSALAAADLLSMADVAFLAKVSTSTLSRLWSDPTWLDGVSGATLQRLITALPGLAGYVQSRSHSARLEAALRLCADAGLHVRTDYLVKQVRQGQSAQYLATVLEAAAAVMRQDPRETVASLARCWGTKQSHALDAVFAQTPEGLLREPEVLTDKGSQLLGVIDTGANGLRSMVGYGILVHKLTRLTGSVPDAVAAAGNRGSAFAHRSGIIGTLLGSGDIDTSVRYRCELEANPLVRRNELWSLATYSGDIALTPELGSAARMGLRRTAAEVIGDIVALPDAYAHYLITTAIPVLLDYDPGFGSRRPALVAALRERLDRGIADPATRTAGGKLLESLR